MRKLRQKLGYMLLAVTLLFGMLPATVFAQEDMAVFDGWEVTEPVDVSDWEIVGENNFTGNSFVRSPMITAVSLNGIHVYENGQLTGLKIYAKISANEAVKMGVKNIVVQKYIGNNTWQAAAYCAGGSGTGKGSYEFEALCNTLERGQTYRIVGTHYAYLSTGYREIENTSQTFIY